MTTTGKLAGGTVLAALLDDRHIGQIYELSGLRLLNFADVASELSAAMGRDIRYGPVTQERYRDMVGAENWSDLLADGFT